MSHPESEMPVTLDLEPPSATPSPAFQETATGGSFGHLLAQLSQYPRASLLGLLRADQRKRWQRGERLLAEMYLAGLPALQSDTEMALDLIFSEIALREELGEKPTQEEYLQRFPQYQAQLQRQFLLNQALASESLLPMTLAGAGTLSYSPPPPPPPAPDALTARLPTAAPGGGATDALATVALPSGSVAPAVPQTDSGHAHQAALPSVPGYEILSELGRGGMGVVYKARQVGLKRLVALKMILAGSHASPQEMARFKAEAEAIAKVQHPHIIQVYDVGNYQGLPYLALEYVEGGSLADKLDGTPLPAQRAAWLVERLALAMQSAHERGIVHRDLKPGNILLAAPRTADGSLTLADHSMGGADPVFGTPKITDFGLAKSMEGESNITRSGAIVGTPSYMAPEQAAGNVRAINPRTDVYALGAILYELVTGRPPFRAANAVDTILQVISEEPIPPSRLEPKLPRDLENICLKCLQKDQARRYPTALALAEDLAAFRAGRPVTARPISIWERGVKWARRYPAIASLIALVVFLSVLGFSLVTWQWRQAQDNYKRAERSRQQEEAQRRAKETALREAQTHLYFNRIALAEREWAANDVVGVLELLNHAPQNLRHWEWSYLRRLCRGGQHQVDGGVCVAISPDGKWLASAQGHRVRVWDRVTRQAVFPDDIKDGHTSRINHVAFSGDSQRLASTGDDGTVRLWQVPEGRLLLTLGRRPQDDPPLSEGLAVAFQPAGSLLACATSEDTVVIWDTAAPAQTPRVLKGHAGTVKAVAFSPDGQLLASASKDGTIRLWKPNGLEVRTLTGHWDGVNSVAFSPEGRFLASGSDDRTVRLWDILRDYETRVLRGHGSSVNCVAFGPEGWLASASGQELKPGEIKLWNALTGEEWHTFRWATQIVNGLAFTPDGRQLASADARSVMLWDTTHDLEARTLRQPPGKEEVIMTVAFHPRDQVLAAAGEDGQVTIWDIAQEQAVRHLAAHTGTINALSYSPDGRWLASASDDRSVILWDSATGHPGHVLLGHGTAVLTVAFSPDGRWLATAGYALGQPGEVRLWDVATGQLLRKLATAQVRALSFHAKGIWLAGAADDPFRVLVWDVATGREIQTLDGFLHPISAVAFSPDGRLLAASGGSKQRGQVRLWDTATWQERAPIYTRTGRVGSFAFHPDSQRLVAATWDYSVKVFDPETRVDVLTLRGHKGSVNGIAFSADGRRVASASSDRTVKIWDGTPLPEE